MRPRSLLALALTAVYIAALLTAPLAARAQQPQASVEALVARVEKIVTPYVERALADPANPDTSQLQGAVEALLANRELLIELIRTIALQAAQDPELAGEQAKALETLAANPDPRLVREFAEYTVHLLYVKKLHEKLEATAEKVAVVNLEEGMDAGAYMLEPGFAAPALQVQVQRVALIGS